MPDSPSAPPLARLLQATARAVAGVLRGRSLTPLLAATPAVLRPGTQALAFDVLRHLGRAQAVRARLARRRPAPAVDALLCSALALLLRDGGPLYAEFTLVDQAVEAAKGHASTRRAASFINGCLRRFLRERAALLRALADDPVARWNHPAWWIARLQAEYPRVWGELLRANQIPPPLDLRVNRRRTTPADYLAELARAGIAAQPVGADGVRLAHALPVAALPGFAAGLASVQSVTAQCAAPLLLDGLANPAPRILDACAAPGGKTAHLLERCPGARLVALEVDARRSPRIRENLDRLGLAAEIRVADAAKVADWWDGDPFDAILLDAPCSASGIVRRHPDVRWLRQADDMPRLAATQDRLLEALWPTLASGGQLLFCTCSVFPEEGEARAAAFVARHDDVQRLPAPGTVLPLVVEGDGAVNENVAGDGDGFFFARFRKR